jgi:UDPglucose 6-dehydrogenase
MIQPIIGFVGMTHLGLVSGISAAEKGFQVICFDRDEDKIKAINKNILSVSEPQLKELLIKNKIKITFTNDTTHLKKCDVVYVAPDITTDDFGKSDLAPIDTLLNLTFDAARNDAVIVVLSQVPPGFSRARIKPGRRLYYQVETLIFGRAVERALCPERYIIGCADPEQALPVCYESFLTAHDCPILKMRYESAELAKISINMCLVASVSTANTLSELCEKIGADWSEIAPALKLDKRIGQYSYLTPGLGIAGGNLERDLVTFCNLAEEYKTDASIVKAWIVNSKRRRSWPIEKIREIYPQRSDITIAVLGLAYKENTNSIKNSVALFTIAQLQDVKLRVYDPVVNWRKEWHPDAVICNSAYEAIVTADVLMILTPWQEFAEPNLIELIIDSKLAVIDPYGLINCHRKKISSKIYSLGQ